MSSWLLENWSWLSFVVGSIAGAFFGMILIACCAAAGREDAWDDGFAAGAGIVRAAERDALEEQGTDTQCGK